VDRVEGCYILFCLGAPAARADLPPRFRLLGVTLPSLERRDFAAQPQLRLAR